MAVDFQPGGRFSATNVPLRILIALAYRVRPEAVTGGPGWLGADRFDIVAKAAQTTPPDGIRRMLQTLLAERFKLQLHSEKKEMPADALLPGKSGTRLQPSEASHYAAKRPCFCENSDKALSIRPFFYEYAGPPPVMRDVWHTLSTPSC